MRVMKDVHAEDKVWLVLAEVGPRRTGDADADVTVVDAIVMAERPSETAAEAECAQRNALDDGRSYFVLSRDELAEALA